MTRREVVTHADAPRMELSPGVNVQMLATGSMGARGLTTSLATFAPRSRLPYHQHPFSEVIVVLAGHVAASVEGRKYIMRPHDALHIPAHTPHAVTNPAEVDVAILHSSFSSHTPARTIVEQNTSVLPLDRPGPEHPESLVRFEEAPTYELSSRAQFRDLFASRFGSRGICGGYGRFEPGSSLPCHFHDYDESITIIEGEAVCLVAGRQYSLSDNGTACIPTGLPHRFLNRSDRPMAMIWVYAGDEPARTLVDAGCCEGIEALATLNTSNLSASFEVRS